MQRGAKQVQLTVPMDIHFEVNSKPLPHSKLILELLERAGTSFPYWTVERMDRALQASSVIICAWRGNELVGFARAISDFTWSGWLSQLAVLPEFQKQGIGTTLLDLVKKELGEEVSLLVHSAEAATGFYESRGFESYANVYRIKRKK